MEINGSIFIENSSNDKLLKVENFEKILNLSLENITNFLNTCQNPKVWLYTIFHFYTLKNDQYFKLLSKDLVLFVQDERFTQQNKSEFIQILNILTVFYTFLTQKTIDKADFEEFNLLSTQLINTSEQIEFTNSLTLIAKGYLLYSKGDYENSEMTFENAYEKEQVSKNKNILILCLYGKGLNSFVKGNLTSSLSFFTQLIEKYNFVNEILLECIGVTLYQLGEVTKSFKIFQQIININKNNFKAISYLAIIELNKAFLSKAALVQSLNLFINSFQILMENNYINQDSCHSLLVNVINLCLKNEKIEIAETLKNKLFSIIEESKFKYSLESGFIKNSTSNNSKKDADKLKSIYFTICGNISHIKKNNNDAVTNYLKAISLNNNNLQAQFSLGQLYFLQEQYSSSLTCFEICKTTQDSFSLYEVNKFISLIKSRNVSNSINSNKKLEDGTTIESVIILLKQLIEIRPDDIDCLIELASILEINNPQESLKVYESCLSLIDANKINSKLYVIEDIYHELLNNICSIKLSLRRYDGVGETLIKTNAMIKEKLAKLDDNSDCKITNKIRMKLKGLQLFMIYNLAIFHEYNKNYAEAYRLYKSIKESNEFFVDAYSKLALLSYYRGNVKKSLEYLKQAIEKHYDEDKKEEINMNNLNGLLKLKSIKSLPKPMNPILLKSIIEWKNISSTEALKSLATAMQLEQNDPFTFVLIGNINYDIAYHLRNFGGKLSDLNMRIQKALEFYFAALELDYSNVYAAVGLANCLAEFNITGPALDIYKSIGEKLHGCLSRLVNEALIYINDKKYSKAINILSKLLPRLKEFDHSDYQDVEIIYTKALLDNGDFDKSISIIKTLIFKYPENLVYRYNLGVAYKQKSEFILNSTSTKVKDSNEAKNCLDKAIPLLESVNRMRKEKKGCVSFLILGLFRINIELL